MKDSLTVKTSITIGATPAQVWKALTTPRLIKKYLMGTDASSDWKEGSPITYTGEYEGKKYHDKGVIKKIEPEKILQSTYLSSMSGKKDTLENYKLVTYEITTHGNQSVLTVTQNNNASEQEWEHSTRNWEMVLRKLKEVVESESK